MSDALTIEILVNGEPETVTVRPEETVVTTLRERLFLTGTKRGCDQGVCGACTVLVDGEPVRGCLTLAVSCIGREVTTIEGLEHNGAPSAVQAAFAEAGAIQCGFCSPGMILAVTSLLAEIPDPSAPEVREAIAANLCRCSGYTKIVEAALMAAGDSR